jgi:hypothetical protein
VYRCMDKETVLAYLDTPRALICARTATMDDDSSYASSEGSENALEVAAHEFEALCASLQIRYPVVTGVSVANPYGGTPQAPLTNQRALLLGQSLQGNPHVLELNLDIFNLVAEGGDEEHDSIAPLLRFIRESRALLKVRLNGDMFHPTNPLPVSILRRFFLAIAESPTIEVLFLAGLTLQPEGFDVLMKTTQSLKTLNAQIFCYFANVVAGDKIAVALGENQTLEHMEIDMRFSAPVLLCLGSHPRLRELILRWSENERPSHNMEALACFLHSSKTLELLYLCNYKFSKRLIGPLMDGIQSSTSMTKLGLESCEFDKESKLSFQHILQPKKDSTRIRELRFGQEMIFTTSPQEG